MAALKTNSSHIELVGLEISPIVGNSFADSAIRVIVENFLVNYCQNAQMSRLPMIPIDHAIVCRGSIQYSEAPQIPGPPHGLPRFDVSPLLAEVDIAFGSKFIDCFWVRDNLFNRDNNIGPSLAISEQ